MYPNGTVPTGSGRYMKDERHSTRRLGKMKSIQLASILGLALFVVSSCILVSESDADGNSVEQNGVTYELTESGGGGLRHCTGCRQ